jgi:hypothetical protein
MAGKKKRAGVEWVGGVATMPAYVTGEGEPYRPDVLLWMSDQGLVLGTTMAKPGEVVGTAADHLRSTIERPMIGRPHAPTRVRVASTELADVLRASHPAIDVVCAPTPEIDAVFAAMRERMDADDAETEQSYLSPEIDAAAVASFFRATAGLYRAKPWSIVPSDESLFAVTIEKLELRDAAVCVIGQMGQSLGVILFSGVAGFEAYVEAAEAMELGEGATMPPHHALNFERGAELSATLRKEIADHRWEVAGAAAYPWLVAVDGDLVARPPTARELTIFEALSLALPEVLADRGALLSAWNGGPAFTRTLSVKTHAGEVEVSVRAPPEPPASNRPPFGVIADLFDLAKDGEEIDHDRRTELEDELVRKFVESPEAKTLTDVQSCHFVMDFAADYFGATIATLGTRELREIIFEIIPRKVSVDASKARWIIEDNRAFYAFLKREYGLPQADACLRVFEGDAVTRLEAALSNGSNFGMAKSLFMAGREAGFDMESKEGIEAWMRAMQGKPLPSSVQLPPFSAGARPVDPAAARAKKNQRKAARKARERKR